MPLSTAGVQLSGKAKVGNTHGVAWDRLGELGALEEQLNGADIHPGVIEALAALEEIATSIEEGGTLPSLRESPECHDKIVSRLVIITKARYVESRLIAESQGDLYKHGTIRENGSVFEDGIPQKVTTATNGHVKGPASELYFMVRGRHSEVFDAWYQAKGHEISQKARS